MTWSDRAAGAAVDVEQGAAEVGRGGGEQERGHATELLGLAVTPERDRSLGATTHHVGRAVARVEGERAERLYKTIFLGYGDDSVAQLGGAHIEFLSGIENPVGVKLGQIASASAFTCCCSW
mgnify:CR=1 FL=1